MSYIAFYNHPTEGFFARTDQALDEIKMEATKFAEEHYPGEPTMDPTTLTGWWLLKDDGLPFFHPKPWPIAFALEKAAFYDAQLTRGKAIGEIPSYLGLLAMSDTAFKFFPAVSIEQAKKKINEITKNLVQLLDNEHGGITGYYTNERGVDLQVAHVIKIK